MRWKITPWGIISSLMLLVLALTPSFAILLGGGAALAFFLALMFWPGIYMTIRESIRSRELPRITGGPRIMWGGRR